MADLAGRSVLLHAVGLFANRPDVARVVIATSADRLEIYRAAIAAHRFSAEIVLTFGGEERWGTVHCALAPSLVSTEFVAIHDAARPVTPRAVIDAAFAGAIQCGAAIPVMAEPATLKRINTSGMVEGTLDRRGIFQAQTPQCFRTQALRDAFTELIAGGQCAAITDDAQVAEAAGIPILATAGSNLNIKLTHAEDLSLARAILEMGHAMAQPAAE